MIKYFQFESFFLSDELLNEKILDEKPETDSDGYTVKTDDDFLYLNTIDLEKFIKYYGELQGEFKNVYDKLLIKDRNNKLETL